jgi:transcriptional regulator with PAS, ATPase and Fis domain
MEDWVKEFPGAVTVCDCEGIVLFMNDKSQQTFAKNGGAELIGKSLINCHPEPARSKLLDMLANPRRNSYTIEKNGVKKIIYQSPWFQDGQYKGFVELSLEIPMEMPHFIRKG